jgi:protein-arginine kinase activator protein McsA
VHLTEIDNGKKEEKHFCQECAEKQELLKQQELNLTAILETVIGQECQRSVGRAKRIRE